MIEPNPENTKGLKNPDIEPLDWLFLLNYPNPGKVFFRVNDLPEILKTILQDHLRKGQSSSKEI